MKSFSDKSKSANTLNSTAVLILAAGTSNRLHPLTKETPKPIIEIENKTMLGKTLNYLEELNSSQQFLVNDVFICVGFQSKKIIDYVKQLELGTLNIKFIENPLYSQLNNNFSVWLAKSVLNGKEFILINGDIFYEKQVLKIILDSEYENASIIDSTKPLPEDSMKLLISMETKLIRAFSKTFYEGDGCTVGIHKFSKKGSSCFFDKLQEQLEQGINSFHHSAIDLLVRNGGYKHHALDIKGLKWCEVDDLNDLQIARRMVHEL